MSRQALFEGLVFNAAGEPAQVTRVGDAPYYVILDDGFRRHVEAATIDRQVLKQLRELILSNRELVAKGAMQMLGKDDLFTKAMIDASLEDLDKHLDELMRQGLPEEARAWLGMLGFQIVVDVHGEVIRVEGTQIGDFQE
jgi:hypothetical protein